MTICNGYCDFIWIKVIRFSALQKYPNFTNLLRGLYIDKFTDFTKIYWLYSWTYPWVLKTISHPHRADLIFYKI